MNMKAIILAATAALALTGCAATQHAVDKVQDVTKSAVKSVKNAVTSDKYVQHSKSFICVNGMSPKVDYINDSQIKLTLEGKTTTLDIQTAASGERYVANNGIFGYGGEWHQKGDMATFKYKNVHGVPAEISCDAE